MTKKPDIKYLNKDFATFKTDLIEYAKSYFPTVYNDFTQASPGSMFINMASYVGDVLSFYLDNQLQETYVQYAKQKNNLFALAYTMGYRPKTVSAAIAGLDVYQVIPAKTSGSLKYPDFDYSLVIQPGMVVNSSINSSVNFYVPEKIDFRTSSSFDETEITVYTTAGDGSPTQYLLKKKANAISGQIKSQAFTFGSAQRFQTVTISDIEIVGVVSAVDSSGNKWYEVPYLAQDFIYNPVANTAANYPDLAQYSDQVPYILEKVKVDRRFTTRFTSNDNLVIEFGPGINSVADTVVIPNPSTVGVGLTSGSNTINTAFDPTNYVTTKTYGLSPSNTTITISYLAGGGASYNVGANELTVPSSVVTTGVNTSFSNTVAVNNAEPATGGGDGDTIDELRQNIQASFASQTRAVTQQDYLVKVMEMPSKYGKISKAYVTKDDTTFANYYSSDYTNKNQTLVSMYLLGLDSNGHLAEPSEALLKNVQTYLSEYRMMTDAINLKPGYVINIGCNFDVIIRPNYTGTDVIARCLTVLKDFFNISNWQINEPIVLSDVYTLLDTVEGVQTVKSVEIVNKSGVSNGYSKYVYDINAGLVNGIIYPSLDPSVFEVKYLDTDIQGRVVSF
jgi:hypothetical protein